MTIREGDFTAEPEFANGCNSGCQDKTAVSTPGYACDVVWQIKNGPSVIELFTVVREKAY